MRPQGTMLLMIGCVLGAVTFPGRASAEPLTIANGGISYFRFSRARFVSTTPVQQNFPFGISEDELPSHPLVGNPGTLFDPSVTQPAFMTLSGQFVISANPFPLPPVPPGPTNQSITLFTPFSFAGTVACGNTPFPCTPGDFVGSGTARIGFFSTADLWLWRSSDYTFEDPSVVPEPSSIALFVTGLSAAAWRHRKRRRDSSERDAPAVRR